MRTIFRPGGGRFFFAIATVLLILAATAADASVFQVDQENLEAGGPGTITTIAGDIGQGFVPQDPFLGGIAIEVGCCLAPDTSSTVRLDVRDGGIAGPIIGSSEIVLTDATSIVSGDHVFQGTTWTFFPALSVTPGTQYVFEVVIVSGGDLVFSDTGDFYAPGSLHVNGSPSAGLDLVFQTGHFVADPKLYWAEAGLLTVERSDLDGTNVETIASSAHAINGVAVDPINSVIYWVECCGSVNGGVYRADIDGGNKVKLNTSATFGFSHRVLLDTENQWLFISDSASGFNDIQRINTDGSSLLIVLGPDPLRAQIDMALDPIADKLYWTEGVGGQAGIHRMNLDGTGVEAVLTAAGGAAIVQPEGLAIDADDDRMYWTDLGRDEVRRAFLDGTGVEVIADAVSHSIQNPMGIALDPIALALYWSDTTRDTITRADLSGQNAIDIISSGLSFPRALDLIPTPAPEPGVHGGLIVGSGLLALLGRRLGRRSQDAPQSG